MTFAGFVPVGSEVTRVLWSQPAICTDLELNGIDSNGNGCGWCEACAWLYRPNGLSHANAKWWPWIFKQIEGVPLDTAPADG